MLVLSRRKTETIRLGDDVIITVLAVRSDNVRVGILAPKSVPVHRGEVYDAIQRHGAQRCDQGDPGPAARLSPIEAQACQSLEQEQAEAWEWFTRVSEVEFGRIRDLLTAPVACTGEPPAETLVRVYRLAALKVRELMLADLSRLTAREGGVT